MKIAALVPLTIVLIALASEASATRITDPTGRTVLIVKDGRP
jgi:hypothetical protein